MKEVKFVNVYESEKCVCNCFVRYERFDKRDALSPFFLVEFNFLHTHPLRISDTLPLLYNKINQNDNF